MEEDNQSSAIVGLDRSKWKILSIGIMGFILALVMGYFLANTLSGESNLSALLISSVLFFSVFVLQIIFIRGAGIINGFILIDTVAILIPFLLSFSLSLIVAWLTLLVSWLNSSRKGRDEINNQLKVKFSRVEKIVLPSAFTGLAIFIAIITVWVNGTSLTKDTFLKIIQPTQPIMQTFLSRNFNFNMTVSKFAEEIISTKTGLNISALPQPARDYAINEALNQLKSDYGLSFINTGSVSDAIYNYLMTWVDKVPRNVRIAVPIGAALLVFLTVKGITYILRYIVFIFTWILYELALITGFAYKSLESRSHEIVSL
ncbi:hypothetical protein GW950_01125 [Candidatus Wolfebacteria bacterium]|nr:hypothetical protein [Candidatus Wolfebacteria bacterium]